MRLKVKNFTSSLNRVQMKEFLNNEFLTYKQQEEATIGFKLFLSASLDDALMGIMALKAIRGKMGNIEDFEYIFINKKAERLVNRTGLAGKRMLEIFPGTVSSGLFNNYVSVADSGIPWEDEVYYNYDGYDFWASVKATKLEDGCLVMYEEITDKTRAQQEMLEMKDELSRRVTDRYFSLFNSIDQGFCIIEMIYDAVGSPVDYRFLEMNSVFEKQTGLKNVTGKTIRELVPDHEEHWFKVYGEVARTGEALRFENRAAHILNSVWYDVYAFRIGNPSENHVAVLFNDITQRKLNEERESFLLTLSDTLRPLSDPADIQSVVSHSALNFFKADRCYYSEIMEDVSIVRRDASRADLPSVAGVYQMDNIPIFKALLDAGRPFVIQDSNTTELLDDSLKKLCVNIQIASFINIPVIKGGILLGVLSITQCKPRKWTDFEVELATEIAERTWGTLDRAKAEAALRESEERFRVLVESTAQSVWETNADGIVDTDSPSWRNYTGQTFEEMLGYGWINAVHPDDRKYAEHQWREAVAAERNVNSEYRIRNSRNGWRWTIVFAAPIRDINGKIVKWVGMNYDITARKIAERQLKEITENLEKLIEERTSELKENKEFIEEITKTIPDLITIHDAESNRIIYANHSDIWKGKFNEEEIYRAPYKKRAQMLIHPDDQEKAVKFLKQRRMLADGEILEVELKNEFGNNDWGWMKIRSKIFKRDSKGKAQQIISLTSNITESKKAELEIKEQAYLIRQVTKTTPDFLYVYDIKNSAIEFLNRDMLGALGYCNEDVAAVSHNFFEGLVHPDDLRKKNKHYADLATLNPNEVRDLEFRLKDRKGNWRWFYARDTFFKADTDGTLKQVLTILQDVTEKKEAKAAYLEEKSANEELRRMNEVMDTFVYAAAHDLKAPISNLKLISEVLSITEDTQTRFQLMDRFQPVLQTLDKTVTGLVNVLAIEKGVHAEVKKIRFEDMLNLLCMELKEKIQDADPELKTSFSACESITYIESYLLSIFRNLITNALKYRSAERKLIIDIHSEKIGKYIFVSFKDNGMGIDLESFKHDLFKPFKRFSSLSEGSGIGLHLIKSIVTKNKGKIEVESKINKGTNFKIYLLPYKK